jgi:hypothetical protein
MKKGQGIDSQSKNSQNNWLEFSGTIGEFAQMRGRIPCEIGENSWVHAVRIHTSDYKFLVISCEFTQAD